MAGTHASVRSRRARRDLLGIYLNDHLAGATAGVELARRAAGSAAGTDAASALQRFATEVTQDRDALLDMMTALGISVRPYKMYFAWIGEKAGRLKLNGHLVSRSPLSMLEELEMLRVGVEGKAAGWRTLRALADQDGRLDASQLDELMSRAWSQGGLLEELRIRAASQILGQ
jgi:hypothetical protein